MMFLRSFTALIISIFLSISITKGQEYLFDAQMLTTEDGLSNLMTNFIYQDSKGFIWISTKYGLNRYDGYTFKYYNAEQNGLNGNYDIKIIYEDDAGNLWLVIPDQNRIIIDVFNPKTEQAIPLETYVNLNTQAPFSISELHTIRQDPKQRVIYIATKTGTIYAYRNQQFEKIIDGLALFMHSWILDKEGDFWLAKNNHLIHISKNGEILEQQELSAEINGLVAANENQLWLKTITFEGAAPKTNIWTKANNKPDLAPFVFTKENKLLNAKIGYLTRTNKGFWYANINQRTNVFDSEGVWLFDVNTLLGENSNTEFTRHLDIAEQDYFTTRIGILKSSIKKSPFHLILDNSHSSDFRGITEDESGNIYFLNDYLFRWNPIKDEIYQFSDFVGTYDLLYQDSIIWASIYSFGNTHLGTELDLSNNQQQEYPSQYGGDAYSILTSSMPNKYLVGHEGGISWLDISSKTVLPFKQYNDFEILKSLSVYHLYQNTHGIWLATNKGIFLMAEEEGILKHFDKASGHLPFDHIRYVFEDELGDFWLATAGGGLIQWKPALDNKISVVKQQFTTQDGLPHDFLYAIYSDNYHRLWITSDNGLIRINKKPFQIKTYTTQDGLPHNEFNLTAHHQSKDGTLYFGGLGGLIRFNPNHISPDSTYQTPLQFTDLKVLKEGQSQLIDQTELLTASNEILFTPSDRLFEFTFALLDFDKPEFHRYAYKIEGYNDNWLTIEENFLRITHLPYGDYTLKIRAQNINKGWSEKELALKMKVIKPFYLQGWFFVLIGTILLSVAYAAFRWRIAQLKEQQRRLEAEVLKRTQTIVTQAEELKQLDKAKTRFFSNITHEFRTPLTLIIGPLEQVIDHQSLPNILRRRMSGMLKNAQHLLVLINQMLDLSKLESGQMPIEVSRGDIIRYTQELALRFQPLFAKKEIRLSFVSNLSKWETDFDQKKWDKIIYNLLSNGIKFTEKGGVIQLSLGKIFKNQEAYIRLDVKDTGIGISKEQLPQIFNRFHQVDSSSTRAQGGTGIGLALVKELVELQGGIIDITSTEGKGTSLEIQLPVLQSTSIKPFAPIPEEEKTLFPWVGDDLPLPKQPVELKDANKLDLLIIEDNDEMREYIRHCLDENRYNIFEAVDGAEGIEKAHSLIPDLIISDVMMPRKNGFAVTEAVRTHVGTSHIPLILLTAKTSLESRLKGWKRGADAYLTKPFSPQELALRIQKLIEIRSLLQKRYQAGNLSLTQDSYQQEDEFILKLQAYILKRIDEPNLNGDQIGQHFSMSRVHLYRKLKALTDYSLGEFVKKVRLEKALTLLQEGELNISEISYDTGFSSVSHFSREFKRAYGKAPSKW